MDTVESLALFGGDKAIRSDPGDAFNWPILTDEDEAAVLELMRKPKFEDEVAVDLFEKEFAAWCGTRYAVSQNCGTAAVLAAMYACGVGCGDEVIGPSATYWAAILPAFNLRATMVFADIDPNTMCLAPDDVERRISPRTKAILVVHQLGYPTDMDAINVIARRHGLKVIEDASHAHGTRYKGRMAGTLGDVAAFSMCGKPIAVGEGGMLVTNDRGIFERSIAWGHNFRFTRHAVEDPYLQQFAGLPLGTVTARLHNLSAAIGRVQLRHYDERMAEIDRAMSLFWDLLDDVPGVRAHRPPKESGSSMGGWYCPHGLYRPEELGGLSVARFVEAVRAEGFASQSRICIKEPLHLHPLVNTCDVYGEGKPTRIAHSERDVRQARGSLPVTETHYSFTVPPFKRFRRSIIEEHARAFRKVANNYRGLLASDRGNESVQLDERGNG